MTMEMETRNETAPAAVEREENRKRGFTLTEIAIVLGIIGLILGAIWVAAAAVYTNMRVARSSQELLQITQSIRSLYATATVTGAGADGTAMTASLIPAGVFPTDSLPAGATSTSVKAPWNGGAINVYTDSNTQAASAAGTGDAFTVQFEGIPAQGCINLLVSSTGSGRDPGMISAGGKGSYATAAAAVTGGDVQSTAANITNLTTSTTTISAATAATTYCTVTAASQFTTASFKFRLRV